MNNPPTHAQISLLIRLGAHPNDFAGLDRRDVSGMIKMAKEIIAAYARVRRRERAEARGVPRSPSDAEFMRKMNEMEMELVRQKLEDKRRKRLGRFARNGTKHSDGSPPSGD
jgi:hypothetical protein